MNWEVYLHIWMVARVGLMHLQHSDHDDDQFYYPIGISKTTTQLERLG